MNKISRDKGNFNPKDWVTVIVSILALITSAANTVFQISININNQQKQRVAEERTQAVNVSEWYNNIDNEKLR